MNDDEHDETAKEMNPIAQARIDAGLPADLSEAESAFVWRILLGDA